MPLERTEAQQAAARANGAKSQGPRSEAGKANSARNNLRHGLSANCLLLPSESRERFNQLADSLIAEFAPKTAVETILVERMISAQWRLKRICAFESNAMFHAAASAHVPPLVTDEGTWHDPAARDTVAFQTVHGISGVGSVFQTSEARYQRVFSQAISQLRRYRADRNNEIANSNPGKD
jgi:hypothetical protein